MAKELRQWAEPGLLLWSRLLLLPRALHLEFVAELHHDQRLANLDVSATGSRHVAVPVAEPAALRAACRRRPGRHAVRRLSSNADTTGDARSHGREPLDQERRFHLERAGHDRQKRINVLAGPGRHHQATRV